jgi:hypothetical protein
MKLPVEPHPHHKFTLANAVEWEMDQRLLVVSPVRNEAAHIELIALALAAQTRRPDLWLVVDDQSTDETPEILARLAERLDFMSVINTSALASDDAPKDRLANAAPPRSFNRGLKSVDWQSFTHIAKLDGDTELPPRYFELLLDEFAHDPALGLAGGVQLERDGDGWGRVPGASDYHVRGGLKCYSRDCLDPGASGVGRDRRDLRAHGWLQDAHDAGARCAAPPLDGERRRHPQGPRPARPMRLYSPFHPSMGHAEGIQGRAGEAAGALGRGVPVWLSEGCSAACSAGGRSGVSHVRASRAARSRAR